MVSNEPISKAESEKLEDLCSKLISRHNILCAIEKAFKENITAHLYLEEARQEAYASGNQSMAVIFNLAIKSMAGRLQEFLNDDCEPNKLQSRIHELESENHMLKAKLSRIENLIREIGL